MRKIPGKNFFVQVRYEDLLNKLWLISLFRINCEIYTKPKLIDVVRDADLRRIRLELNRRRILRNIHAPIYDPRKYGLGVLREAYSKSARLCNLLGAKTIVMHVEYEPKAFPDMEEWLKAVAGIWRWIAASAERDSLSVFLENHHESSAEPILRILKETSSEKLAACFDVGHFNAFGLKDAISCLNDYPEGSIREIHLSDNLGDADTHLALGMGSIDFPLFFKAIEARSTDPIYTLEADNIWGAMGGLLYLKRIGRL